VEIFSRKFVTLQDEYFEGEFKRAYSTLKGKNLLSKLLNDEFLGLLENRVIKVARSETILDDVIRLRDFYEAEENFVRRKIGDKHYNDFINSLENKRQCYSILALGTLKEMQKRGFYCSKLKLIATKPY